ncbi:PilW family protein [Ramlibacter sp. AN1015]|uniref:PilW family protein n=1 Tax=Ramlibacter sp. AN1015 TaxID=3133428 RepID=UPI0030BF84B2
MPSIHPRAPRRRQQAGLTLIELMVALVVNLMVIGGLLFLLLNQATTRDEMSKATQAMESGRHASRVLRDALQHAGFYGNYFDVPAPTAAPGACETAVAALTAALRMPVQGFAGASGSPISACIPNANYVSNTDILVVRRADTNAVTIATAAADAGGRMYLQATGTAVAVNTAANATAANFPLLYNTSVLVNAPVELRRLVVQVYFVSPCKDMANGSTCAASDDNGRPIPTLKRLELSATGATTNYAIVPLAEGIQDLQLDYGLDQDNDGFADTYVALPATLADWSRAVAVRFNMLARNVEPSPGHVDTKTYDLGGAARVGPLNDAFKRHVYSDTVRLVNVGGRRATQ